MDFTSLALNARLADLPRLGAIMVARGHGIYKGREVELTDIDDKGKRYTRAMLDGVVRHFPSRALSDYEIVCQMCATVPTVGT